LNVPDGFEFGFAETDTEIDETVQFNVEIFGESYGKMLRRFLENIPGFESEMNSFIRDSDSGKIISSLVAFPCNWSYDGITIRNLELVFVGTSEAYRNRGFFSILYEYLDKLLNDGEYDISSVQGIPYFYRKYGYDLVIPESYLSPIVLPIGNIPPLKPEANPAFMDIVVRTAEDDDIESLMTLFQETNQKLLVSCVRSKELWQIQERLRMELSWKFETLVLEKDGVVDGYFRLIQQGDEESKDLMDALSVNESSIRSYDSMMRALYYLKEMAQEKRIGLLKVPGNLYSNLGTIAQDYGGTRNLLWKHQLRVPDLTRFLNRIHPVLEKRLKGTLFENLTKEIFLNTYRSCHRLNFVNGLLDPIQDIGSQPPNTYGELRFPPDSFIRLMLGDYSISELKKQNVDFIIKRGYETLLETLFPAKESFIYHYHC